MNEKLYWIKPLKSYISLNWTNPAAKYRDEHREDENTQRKTVHRFFIFFFLKF